MWSRPFNFFLFLLLPSLGISQGLAEIEKKLQAKEYHEVIVLSDELLKSTQDLNRSKIYQIKADAYYFLNDLEASLEHYFLAINQENKSEYKNYTLLLECYSHAGYCYRELGLLNQAFPHYEQALKIAIELNDSSELASQYYSLGTLSQKVGSIEFATTMLDSAYKIDVARSDTTAIGYDLALMSSLHSELGKQEKAIQYAKESLDLLRPNTANTNTHANRLSLIASCFLSTNQLDSAAYYYHDALEEYIVLGDSLKLAARWLDLAQIAKKKRDYPRAINRAEMSKKYYSQYEESYHTVRVSEVLADIYFEMFIFDKTRDILLENQERCERLGLLTSLKKNYKQQIELYKKTGAYQLEKSTFLTSKSIQDSIQSTQDNKELARLELQYKFDKLERKNSILTELHQKTNSNLKESKTQIMWLAIAILIVMVVLTTIIYLIRKRNLTLQVEVDELRTQIKNILEEGASSVQLEIEILNAKLLQPLSEREFEILTYAVSNLNNNEIAEKIFISVNTVKFHLKNVYGKLGVPNRKEAKKLAFEIGGA